MNSVPSWMQTKWFALAGVVLAVFTVAWAVMRDPKPESSSSTPPPRLVGSEADIEASRVALNRCLSRNGVVIPTTPGAALTAANRDKARALITDECRAEAEGSLRVTETQRQALVAASRAFFSCLRKEGVDVPDPAADGAPQQIGDNVDRSDPAVRSAVAACSKDLPPELGGGTTPQ